MGASAGVRTHLCVLPAAEIHSPQRIVPLTFRGMTVYEGNSRPRGLWFFRLGLAPFQQSSSTRSTKHVPQIIRWTARRQVPPSHVNSLSRQSAGGAPEVSPVRERWEQEQKNLKRRRCDTFFNRLSRLRLTVLRSLWLMEPTHHLVIGRFP